MIERDITAGDVRREHVQNVKVGAHWAYLATVLGGGLILMVLFIAALGAASVAHP